MLSKGPVYRFRARRRSYRIEPLQQQIDGFGLQFVRHRIGDQAGGADGDLLADHQAVLVERADQRDRRTEIQNRRANDEAVREFLWHARKVARAARAMVRS